MSLRRVRVLVENLPLESCLVTELPPVPAGTARTRQARWGHAEWLLADVHDLLAGANWQRAGDPKARYPRPYPRPGDTRPAAPESTLTPQQLARLRARGPRREEA